MGLFNNDKAKVELNELIVKAEINSNDIIAVRRDIENKDKEYEETFKLIFEKFAEIEKGYLTKISILEDDKQKVIEEYNISRLEDKIKNEYMTGLDICKKLNINNINQTVLKFYLYENGIYNMSINTGKNTFSLNDSLPSTVDIDLINCLIIDKPTLLFKDEFIDYAEKHKEDISASILRYNNKKEQYKISTKKLGNKIVEDYKEEIKNICGTDSNLKWNAIYKVFSQKYKNFHNDYNKYIEANHVDGKYDISRVAYVVSIIGEGNYLLKIACELFVNNEIHN